MAARKLGLAEVPCIQEDHLTDAQRRAYILADNRLALDAGWDEDMLRIELDELRDLDFDISLIGFSDEELDEIWKANETEVGDGDEPEDGEISVDETVPPVTVEGDVWVLGEHRLICGDSTRIDVVDRLFAGAKPNLMVTDPPYGVNYDPAKRLVGHSQGRAGDILNDDRASWMESYSLFPGNVAYVWHASLSSDVVIRELRQCGFSITSMIVWNKSQFALGFSDYHWKHEPCIYATRGDHNWHGGRDKCTVWDIPMIKQLTGEEGAWGHGTQKPIECMKRPIENNSVEGEYVYDPFCGSGTTLIACEKTKRRCLAVELSPNWCDAIVRRWQQESGGQAVLESTGETFDSKAGHASS